MKEKPTVVTLNISIRALTVILLVLTLATVSQASMPVFDAARISWVSVGEGSSDLKVSDIDGDGMPEILTRDKSGVRIIHYQIAGSSSQLVSTPSHSDRTLDLGDLDSDGDKDIVVSSREQYSSRTYVYIYLNNGSGYYTYSKSLTLLDDNSAHCRILKVVDVNNDGKLDIVGNVDGGQISDLSLCVILNRGNLSFDVAQRSSVPNTPTGHQDDSKSLEFFDITNDGNLDALCGNANGVTEMYSNANGGFTHPGATGFHNMSHRCDFLASGDANGDGVLDVAVAGTTGSRWSPQFSDIQVIFGGSGGLSSSVNLSSEVAVNDLCVTMYDLDGDGDEDVLAGHEPSAYPQPHITINEYTSSGYLSVDNASKSIIVDIPQSTGSFGQGLVSEICVADASDDEIPDIIVLSSNNADWYVGILQGAISVVNAYGFGIVYGRRDGVYWSNVWGDVSFGGGNIQSGWAWSAALQGWISTDGSNFHSSAYGTLVAGGDAGWLYSSKFGWIQIHGFSDKPPGDEDGWVWSLVYGWMRQESGFQWIEWLGGWSYALEGGSMWSYDFGWISSAGTTGLVYSDRVGWMYIGDYGGKVWTARFGWVTPYRDGTATFFWSDTYGWLAALGSGAVWSYSAGAWMP